MATRTAHVRTNHRAVTAFFRSLDGDGPVAGQDVRQLLAATAQRRGWTLHPDQALHLNGDAPLQVAGVFRSDFSVPRGFWETKPAASRQQLETFIQKRLEGNFPAHNTLFEDQSELVLYQDGAEKARARLRDKKPLVTLLNEFYGYASPAVQAFEAALTTARAQLPATGQQLAAAIQRARTKHPAFQTAHATLYHICRDALYNKLSQAAVDEMLVQHLLVERLIRNVFGRGDFLKKNAMAEEIERTLAQLPDKYVDRPQLHKDLDAFYKAAADVAAEFLDPAQRQSFVVQLWAEFMQGHAVKHTGADRIDQTPPPLVDAMCRLAGDVLQSALGWAYGDQEVVILDPAAGTGDVVVNLLRRLPLGRLPEVYTSQLFANEMLLMPYYLAAINIERAYAALVDNPISFKGLAFADTLDLKKQPQMRLGLFREKNAERLRRQQDAPLTLIIGNPLTYAGKINESNRRRRYRSLKRDPLPGIDDRIDATYRQASQQQKPRGLYETDVRFVRWATDRLAGRRGVICLLTRNALLHDPACDGLRQHLATDFDQIYHLDLHGQPDAATPEDFVPAPVLDDEPAGGVGLTLLVMTQDRTEASTDTHSPAQIHYHAVDFSLSTAEKLAYLDNLKTLKDVPWQRLKPDAAHNWQAVVQPLAPYADFPLLGSPAARRSQASEVTVILRKFSTGVDSKRDGIVYAPGHAALEKRVKSFIDDYNAEVARYQAAVDEGDIEDLDAFLNKGKLPWSDGLKAALQAGQKATYTAENIRRALYKPFAGRHFYMDELLNDDLDAWASLFPGPATEAENRVICLSSDEKTPFSVLMADCIVDQQLFGGAAVTCLPFYVYGPDGSSRTENLTDWALTRFREHYNNRTITKWDVFYYLYAVLHHPGYREHYTDQLAGDTPDLPRIPLLPDFRAFSQAGQRLAALHLNPLDAPPFKLEEQSKNEAGTNYTVKKLRLNKKKGTITVNPTLTLSGVPTEAFTYTLGSRSALEWFIETYQADAPLGQADGTDEAEQASIVRVLGQIITISLETLNIIQALPPLPPAVEAAALQAEGAKEA